MENPTIFQPPDGFEPTPSRLEGIRIFAPKSPEAEKNVPVVFECPNCGAPTAYDVKAGGVACEHCGYIATVTAATVGRQAKQSEFTLEALEKAEKGWGEERKVLHCDQCGAELALSSKAITASCPFCASNLVNLRTQSTETLRPQYLIPFKVTTTELNQKATIWLGKGWFHPDQLKQSAILNKFMGIYLPYWGFAAAINARWEAEVGYERQERYYDHSSKEWRTRTKIDWRHEQGEAHLDIDDLLITATSHVSKRLLNKILPFPLDDLTQYQLDYLAGWSAHSFDRPLADAWEEGKELLREQARQTCHNQIPSHHVRNFKMLADFDNESWRYLLLPVYLASYKFEEKTFQVLVNGQTGKVDGQKPVAWWKIWTAMAALLSPGGLLVLIGLPLVLAMGVGVVPLVLGFILLVVGGIISFTIYQKAVESEAG